jgi:hypothetical protein
MILEISGNMKKIILLFLLSIFALSVSGQVLGDGRTPLSAYYGTLNSFTNWTYAYNGGTIYVGQGAGTEDLTIGNGGSLTIDAGVKVVFCTLTSDLIVTNSGQLHAGGTGSPVTFTRYSPFNNYWGHIYFTSNAGASDLNNCIIEYGDVTRNITPANYGGGILADINNLSITNCTIRNNKAEWGGGIFVQQNRNPTIRNCNIQNNLSNQGGGGIYLWNYASSLIENCIFESNHCIGTTASYYTGGGLGTQSYCSIKLLNCTFINNSSDRSMGQSVMFYLSANDVATNCILWGVGNQLYLSGTSSISNCAVQGSAPIGTGNFVLNSSNSAIDGPNFSATDGSDWSIKYVSPCRDAGTITNPTIPTDFIGNPRIGPYDIGAYEVQYSRWSGTTNTNWSISTNWEANLLPTPSTSNVVIPPASNTPDIHVPGVTLKYIKIETGGKLTIAPSGQVTVDSLRNNGTLNLTSDATGMYSLMMNKYAGSGFANVEMYLTGGGGTNHWAWHYVAIPTPYRISKTVFTSIEPLNLMAYSDFYILDNSTATDNDGWIWHDGYQAGPPPGMSGPSFTNLFPGTGYAFYHSSASTVNFSNLTSLIPDLSSLLLQYNGGGKTYTSNYGFNLVGNSLTCGLNWNLISPSGDINNSIYYTINYKIGSYVRGAPSGINGASEHIPPLQGFLVRANASGASLDFTNAREHTTQQRYKKSLDINKKDTESSSSTDPMIKLELDNSSNQDETLIWFNHNATTSFDGDYDGLKILSSGYDQIYSWSSSKKYGINAMPLPDKSEIIFLGVKLLNSGSGFKIFASQFQGLNNYNVTLTDKSNSNFIVDLKTTSGYTFSSDAGTFPDRFILTIDAITTGVKDPIIQDKAFNVYVVDKTLNIDLLKDGWDGKSGLVNIYDLTGRKVLQQTNVEWYKGALTRIPLNISQGVYIVEIKAENNKFVTKINIIK